MDALNKLLQDLGISKVKLAKYCSLSTLLKTLGTGKMRLNSIVSMNDRTEVDYLSEYTRNFKETVEVNDDKYFFADKKFITSFTVSIDDLNMWRFYGDDAQGVCMVFEKVNKKSIVKKVRYIDEANEVLSKIQKLNHELAKDNIKVVFSGRRENLSDKVLACIDKVTEITKDNTGGTLNVCFNYGSKSEIVDACNKLAKDNKEITEENISQYLYQDIPPLDLVIRTSGEYRLSNFMLWQASYAELYFTKVYFPDFDEHEFDLALEEYNHRHRRFGGN